MKKLLFIVGISLYWCQICTASPFLVCDPSAAAIGGQFEIQEGGKQLVLANNQTDGSIRYDLASITAGEHSYQIRYVMTDPLWGTLTSAWTPFDFQKPSIAGSITGIKIVK